MQLIKLIRVGVSSTEDIYLHKNLRGPLEYIRA